jgi:hypothetical protein
MKEPAFDATPEFRHFKEVMRGVLAVPKTRMDELVREAKESRHGTEIRTHQDRNQSGVNGEGRKQHHFLRINLASDSTNRVADNVMESITQYK